MVEAKVTPLAVEPAVESDETSTSDDATHRSPRVGGRGRGSSIAAAARGARRLVDAVLGHNEDEDEDEDGAPRKGQPKAAKAVKSILKSGHDHGRRKGADRTVRFRTVLAGDEAQIDDERVKLMLEAEQRERHERLMGMARLARVPMLTLEELMIPLRLAFPTDIAYSGVAATVDVLGDLFELCWIYKTIKEQPTLEEARKKLEAASKDADDPSTVLAIYTAAHAVRDIGTVLTLHFARGVYIVSGDDTLWTLVQVVRAVRVAELVAYVQQINNDLSTNVKFLAVYKFSLVLISVPHWVACIWWALSSRWAEDPLDLPTWPAQIPHLTHNAELDPERASLMQQYLISVYMAWMGLTSMGYGTIILTVKQEVLFAAAVATIQMVFYAFVLGTLFHYLVRTDENTVHYNELMKAVDEYVQDRKLPKELAAKIRAHYVFQHRKLAAGTDRINGQMPLSLRTEVAAQQHMREMEATWVFWACTPQFLSYLTLHLRERYMMPSQTLFKRGDGAAELLWCIGGSLHVWKGEQLITTVRSDVGAGQIVGEVAFFIGIPHPYTVLASTKGEVTLSVLTAAAFLDIIAAYPEQTDHIRQNLLRKYGLDKNGADLASGGSNEQMDEDELREYEALRATVRAAIVERNEELFSQMSMAVHQGDVETVRALTARGFDLGARSYDKRTPLHLACMEGHRNVVKALCDLGADTTTLDRFGASPFENAVSARHSAVADELSRAGAQLRLDRPASWMHSAAKSGDMPLMTMLVAHGVHLNAKNYDGRTALHVAATEGNTRVAEYLISNMADVHTRDRHGRSPLDDAIILNHQLVAQMLVRASARPDEAHMAFMLRDASAGGDVDRLRFLLTVGASVNATDYDKRTPLHFAVASGSISTAYLLVKSLADVNAQDRWHRPPLVDALEIDTMIASVLLQAGALMPAHFDAEASLQARLRDAQAIPPVEVSRHVTTLTVQHETHSKAVVDKSREVEVAISDLASELGHLQRSQRHAFRNVGKWADVWINEYAEELDSDTDSDPDDVEDDDDARDSDSDGSDAGGGQAAGAAAIKPAAERDARAASKQFIKLVLQLPSAEAGLLEIRDRFASLLSADRLSALDESARRAEEDRLLYTMLQDVFELDAERADAVVNDVYAELHTVLGDSAPAPPARAHAAAATASAAAARSGAPPPAPPSAERSAADEMEAMAQPHGSGGFHGRRTSSGGPAKAAAVHRVDSKSAGSFKDSLRRGSKTGTALIDLSMQLNETRAHAGRPRAAAPPASQPGLGWLEIADTDGPVFLSDLGHVVLFCSRRFIDVLAERHGKRRHREAMAKAAAADPSPRAAAAAAGSPESGPRMPSSAVNGLEGLHDDSTSGGGKRGGRLSGMAKRLRESFGPDASAAAAAKDGGGGGAGSQHGSPQSPHVHGGGAQGIETKEARALASIEEACFVITRLFRVFDSNSSGEIRMRDVRKLQGELGELGSAEIKSLLTYLMAASRTFAAPADTLADEGEPELPDDFEMVAVAGRKKSLARPPIVGARGSGAPSAQPAAPLRKSQTLRTSLVLGKADDDAEDADGSGAAGASALVATAPTEPKRAHVAPTAVSAASADESAPAHEDGRQVAARATVAFCAGADAEASPPADDSSAQGSFGGAKGSFGSGGVHGRSLISAGDQLIQLRPKARARLAQSMSEPQFFIGVSSWILLAVSEDAGEREGAAAGGGAGVGIEHAEGVFIPRLKKGEALGAPKPTPKPAQAKAKAAKAEAARLAAAEAALVAELHAALGTATALVLLGENVQMRIEAGRLGAVEPVDADALLAVVNHAIAIPLDTTRAHIAGWLESVLGLSLNSAAAAGGGGAEGGGSEGGKGDADDEEEGSPGMAHRLLLSTADLDAGAVDDVTTWEKLLARLRDRAAAIRADGGGVDPVLAGAEKGAQKNGLVALLEAFDIQVGSRVVASDNAAGAEGAGSSGAPIVWPWYIVSVHSYASGLATTLFFALVLWDVLTVPMQLCFFEEVVQMNWVPYVNLTCDVLYALRIVLRFHTTFINEKSVEVFHAREVRANYLATDFVPDLFACWPHDQVLWALGIDPMIRFGVRMLRLLNARYLLASFKAWRAALSERDIGRGLIKNALPLVLLIHYGAGLWNVIGFSKLAHTFWETTWADIYEMQRMRVGGEGHLALYTTPEEKLLDHYITAVFFVLSLVSALGVVQLPANYVEFAMFTVFATVNMTIYAYCVGGISGIVMKQDDEIVGKRAHLELVHSYVRHVHVSTDLKGKMTKFFVDKLQHASLTSVDSEQIYSGLPVPLQMEVSAHTNRALVGNAALLRGCSDGFLDRLSSVLRERELEAETVVFRAGEACKELVLLASGTVELIDDAESAASDDKNAVCGAGETLGEVAFVFNIRHYKTARVSRTDKANSFVLNREVYRELLKSFPSQEDLIMDNAVRQYEGSSMTSARSARSKASTGGKSSHSSQSSGSRDDASIDGHSDAGASDIFSLQKTLTHAKMKRDEQMHARICTACVKGDFEKVRRLLSARSMDIDHADGQGRRALQLAACGGDKRVIDLLLAARADVNAEDRRGHTALDDALQADQLDAAAQLASHGGRHGSRNVSEEMCAFGGTADGASQLQRLCQFGGDVNAATLEQRSALHVAAAEGCVENLKLLLENSADVNARDSRGATALQDALIGRKDEACALLLQHGAELGEFDMALHLNNAAAENDVVHLRRIIEFSCSVNTQDNLGRAPIHLAAASANINALNFLVEVRGIDVNLEDMFGNTALDDALRDAGPTQKVVVEIMYACGGREGSHVSRSSRATGDVEAKRVGEMRRAISAREQMMRDVRALRAWVLEERGALQAFRGELDKAIALQRQKGAVLADEMPELWEHIYNYAEGYFDWRTDAMRTLAPTIERWTEDAKDFALFACQKLKIKYDEIVGLSEVEAKPVERLYEVTFRRPVKVDAR